MEYDWDDHHADDDAAADDDDGGGGDDDDDVVVVVVVVVVPDDDDDDDGGGGGDDGGADGDAGLTQQDRRHPRTERTLADRLPRGTSVTRQCTDGIRHCPGDVLTMTGCFQAQHHLWPIQPNRLSTDPQSTPDECWKRPSKFVEVLVHRYQDWTGSRHLLTAKQPRNFCWLNCRRVYGCCGTEVEPAR